jgi:two-component system phosphate regulon sensor histidine kinase PhoR
VAGRYHAVVESNVASGEGLQRGFRRIVGLLVLLVLLPTVVLLVLGILMLVFWQAQLNVVFGILVVTLVACLVTGAVLVLVLLRREAQLSKLQMDFVSKVSHELRTPLTSIRMFAETLRLDRARDDAERQLCLEVLDQETARLSVRIERLLDWGRMEAGRRIYELSPDSVIAAVHDAVETFDGLLVASEREVRLALPERVPPVELDRAAFVDALLNLLSNAHKYSPDGTPIEVRVTERPRQVRVSVSDRGIGIPRREHRAIFQKFYRVDERLSSSVEGSGLGLAIVRHVMAGHGGRVEVDSEPGEGSTFTLVLPTSGAVAERVS